MEKRTIIASKLEEIIEKACQREQSCEVQRVGAEGVMRSRLLEATTGQSNPHVVMDLPSEGGRATTVREGDRIEVTTQAGGQRLIFLADVKGRCFHQVREGTWIPAMLVTYPAELEVKQRRAYYRVSLSRTDTCEVVFGLAGTDQEDPAEPVMSGLCRGLVEDLSAGGMGIQYGQDGPENPGVGTRVRVFFELPGAGGNVALVGRIRNVRPCAHGQVLLGVEFMASERNLEARKGLGAIGQYVAARQREMLRKNADA